MLYAIFVDLAFFDVEKGALQLENCLIRLAALAPCRGISIPLKPNYEMFCLPKSVSASYSYGLS